VHGYIAGEIYIRGAVEIGPCSLENLGGLRCVY
jgi:hypothetical protein